LRDRLQKSRQLRLKDIEEGERAQLHAASIADSRAGGYRDGSRPR
jgi:hypothetical protein